MRLGLYLGAAEGTAGASLRDLLVSLGAVVVSLRADVKGDGVAIGASAGAHGDLSGDPHLEWDALVVGAAFGDDVSALRVAIAAFARAGKPVLGIGGGFQSLCALGLLPGCVVARGAAGAHGGEGSYLRVEGRPTPFTSAIPAGRVLRSAPVTTRLTFEIGESEALRARGQVIFRHCDAAGGTVRAAVTGGGPADSIAGVCDEAGNVVGLLGAPEIVGGDGAQLLASLRLHQRYFLRPPSGRDAGRV